MPDLDQINITVTDIIPPDNFATVDAGAKVGTVYTKEQDNAWRKEVEAVTQSGIKGVLKPDTPYDAVTNPYPTPWAQGDSPLYEKYDVNQAGTFPNTKDINDENIVVTQNDIDLFEVQIWIKNGIAQLYKKAMPQAIQFIPSFTGSTFPLVSTTSNPIQRTHDNSSWELIPGQTASASDIPGVSSKWVSLGISKGEFDFNSPKIDFPLNGFYDKNTGAFIAVQNYYSSNKFLVAEGMKFINYFLGSGNASQVVFFKKDGTFLSSQFNQTIITTPINAYQVAFTTQTAANKITVQSGFWGLQTQARQNNDLTSLMTTKDDVIYNSLLNKINELSNQIEISAEEKQALFIEMASFTSTTYTNNTATPTNPKNIITVTNTSNNVLTGDFSVWGATKIIKIAFKYADGSHDVKLISDFTATTATAVSNFSQNVVEVSALFDENLGQHLTEIGYKAMGERLFNFSKRTAFRQTLKKQVDFSNHTKDAVLVNGYYGVKDNAGVRVLDFKLLNAYPIGYIEIAALSIEAAISNTPRFSMFTSATIGQGIEIPLVTDYSGFVEMYLGTRLSIGAGSGIVVLKKDGVEQQSIVFKGDVKRVIMPHSTGNYTIEIKVNEAINVNIQLSSISFWSKRNINESIWNSKDRVLFLTDSWGEYPVTTVDAEKPLQFNGLKRDGKCTMPLRFKELFVAAGGNANNVFLCTRGGFTTAWAKNWIDKIVQQVNPTKIVFHFGINDRNSYQYLPSSPSAYDFDPENIFTAKLSNAGGIFGSVSKDSFADNLLYLKRYCIARGITPIFFMLPFTASSSQAQELMTWNRDIFLKGF